MSTVRRYHQRRRNADGVSPAAQEQQSALKRQFNNAIMRSSGGNGFRLIVFYDLHANHQSADANVATGMEFLPSDRRFII